MAITVADWWDQYVVGPSFLYLIVAFPVLLVVEALTIVTGLRIEGNSYYLFLWFLVVLSAFVVTARLLIGGMWHHRGHQDGN